MDQVQSTKSLPQVLFILDERLSREKAQILMRNVNLLRRFAQVELLKGATTQDELLQKIESGKPLAVFAPWYRYLAWQKVESHLGIARVSGTVFAGYFADQLLPYELEELAPGLNRALLFDFNNITGHELLIVLKCALSEPHRSGLSPLIAPSTQIHYESWLAHQGAGFRIDRIMRLPGLDAPDWRARAAAIRIALNALWTLIYEEGPGKSELSNAVNANVPHAYFQIAIDERCVALRICYTQKAWNPRDFVSAFWPNSKRPSSAAQLLLRYADMLRIHPIGDTGEAELTLLFFPSAVAERFSSEIHTLWIDPISPKSLSEKPYSVASQANPRLLALPEAAAPEAKAAGTWAEQQIKQRDRLLGEAATAIRKLKMEILARDQAIAELRSGGVGCAKPSDPPDAEALLAAFEERLEILRREIQAAQDEANRLGSSGAPSEAARKKVEALQAREQSWLKQILKTLKTHQRTAA